MTDIADDKNQKTKNELKGGTTKISGNDYNIYWNLIEFLRKRYEESGDAIFVWRAIQESTVYHLSESTEKLEQKNAKIEEILRLDPEKRTKKIEENPQLFEQVLPKTYEIPAWCLVYLGIVGTKLMDLSLGLDRELQPPTPSLSMPEEERMVALQKHLEWISNPTITPQEALDRVAGALGFKSQGRNAFAQHRRDTSNEQLAIEHERLRQSGYSSTKAFAYLAELYGLDDRTIRRKIKSAKAQRKQPNFQRHLAERMRAFSPDSPLTSEGE